MLDVEVSASTVHHDRSLGARPHRSPRWLRSVRRRPAAFMFLFALSALSIEVDGQREIRLRPDR